MKLPAHRRCLLPLLAALIIVSAFALTACFGIEADPEPAATVNGESVYEDDVTAYIEGFRSKNDSYSTDEGWATYLASSGYTPESFRTFVLNNIFIPKVVVRQECDKRNIKVTDEILDDVIAREKAYYEQRYGADTWESVLSSYDYDEESWRENEENRLLEEQLADEVVGAVEPTHAQIQSWANENASQLNGKHSYYIEFETEEEASEARDGLKFNAKHRLKFKRFKAAGTTVDAGWSSLASDADALDNSYAAALNELSVCEVSEPVEVGEAYCLIYCDEIYSVGDKTHVNLQEMPSDLYNEAVEQCADALEDEKFDTWLEKAIDQADIEIVEMPKGLSYDTDIALGSS